MHDPYTLTPDRAAEPELGAQPDTRWRRGRDIAPELDGVVDRGFRHGCRNTRIVRRSNALLDCAYGRRSSEYAEQMSMGSSFVAPVAAAMATAGNAATWGSAAAISTGLPRKPRRAHRPQTGHRPQRTRARKGHYKVETYTTTTTGARYRATMSQKGDPATRRPRYCWARADWLWRWTATGCRTCAACSPRRRRWVTR